MSEQKKTEEQKNKRRRKHTFSKLFHDDRFLRAFSIFAAIVTWFIVAMNVSPETSRVIRDIPVQISTDGMSLSVIGGTQQTVDVVIRGARNIVGGVTADDISVIAVLDKVDGPGTYDLDLRVSKRSPNSEFEIVSYPSQVTKVRFDTVVTKELEVETDVSGIKVADGFVKVKSTAQPAKVTVSGPETEVEQITRCVAKAELSDVLKQTVTVSAGLTFYNTEGTEVSAKGLNLSEDTVQVTVPILKTKEVPISFDYLNMPDGFDISKLPYTVTPSALEIAGPEDKVDSLSSLNLGYIDFKNLALNTELTYDVVIPTNFTNLSGAEQVKVKFDTTGYESKVFTVPNVRVVNAPEGYTVTVETESISNVTVVGTSDVLASLAATDLVAEVNMNTVEIAEGRMSVAVTVYAPSKGQLWAYGEYTVTVNVSKN